MSKIAILLTAFGASSSEARKAYEPIDDAVRQAWPGVETRWAFTSRRIIARMRERGVFMDTPTEALERLRDEGFESVTILPLLTVAGEEHAKVAALLCEGLQTHVCRPLLSREEDVDGICAALAGSLRAGAANILVCHGNKNNDEFNELLVKLAEAFRVRFRSFAFSVEGRPGMDDFHLARAVAQRTGCAHFAPFMMVAGEHVSRDVMGDELGSWKNMIGAENTSCASPLGKNVAIVEMFLERLREGMRQMEGEACNVC